MTSEIVQIAERDVVPALSPKAFVARLQQTMEAIQEAKDSLLTEGTDFGQIPGTDKPTLFQPGAELMLRMFGFGFRYEIEERVEDWDTPFFRYQVKGIVTDQAGNTIAEGPGEANSKEPRYLRRQCPKCESGIWDNRKQQAQGKFTDQAPFTCKSKQCGFTAQKPSDVPEVFDFSLVNTMMKMAVKRAKVAAALTATGGSHFFTQDVEDLQDDVVANVDAPAQTSRGSQGSSGGSRGNPELKCPACGSSVYDNRPDIASGKRSEKYPAFKCSNKDCEGVTEDREKVTDGKEGEPFVTWSSSYFDGPGSTSLDSDELLEVQAHIDTGAITEAAVLSIARRLARDLGESQPTSLLEIDGLPEAMRVAVVEAVAEKIGGGD